jgi:hypothetical protein
VGEEEEEEEGEEEEEEGEGRPLLAHDVARKQEVHG